MGTHRIYDPNLAASRAVSFNFWWQAQRIAFPLIAWGAIPSALAVLALAAIAAALPAFKKLLLSMEMFPFLESVPARAIRQK
jgi:hypothetical protein